MDPNFTMWAESIIICIVYTMMGWCQQYSYGVHLIERLDKIFHFDHYIYYMDSATDLVLWFPVNNGTKIQNFASQTILTFDNLAKSVANITEEPIVKITGKNTFLVVVVERLTFENDSKWLSTVKYIRALDVNIKIGVFIADNATTLGNVEQLLHWSWNAGIANIFCAFRSSVGNGESTFNVYKYNPFVSIHSINVTKSESLQDYFFEKKAKLSSASTSITTA